MDYEKTFNPVPKMISIRVVLSLVVSKGWKLWQLDVKKAFLYGEIDQEIYIEQPPGFMVKDFPHYVCHLKKALFGLKQASRAWFDKIAQYLNFCDYIFSNANTSLFYKKNANMHIIVLLYVDDMVITGDQEKEVAKGGAGNLFGVGPW